MTVGTETLHWAWCECMILVTEPNVPIDKETFTCLQVKDIVRGFEQLYKAGEQLPPDDVTPTAGRPLWASMPLRKIALSLALMRKWSKNAEWFPKRSQ
jgi:hypothetical protein